MTTPIRVAPITPTLPASLPAPPVNTGVMPELDVEPVGMEDGHDIEEVGHMEGEAPIVPVGIPMVEVGIIIPVGIDMVEVGIIPLPPASAPTYNTTVVSIYHLQLTSINGHCY